MMMRGANIVMECLLEQGVDTVFGFPGGQIIVIYDALYDYRDRIRHILTSHEQHATHAADGYARATGKVGVVMATSGPGATNLVTGIANAYMDSVPLVAITGNVPTTLIGRDSFQEVDITGVTMPVTKYNFFVKSMEDLAPSIRRAFAIAVSGRPGPVLVDIPKDISTHFTEYAPEKPAAVKTNKKTPDTDKEAMARALEMLHAAKRPVIYAGGGIVASGASKELSEFAKKLHAPVCCSIMGLSGYSAKEALFAGLIGMHGSFAAAKAVSESDLIVAIGARFSDRVAGNRKAFGKQANILHIDIDAAEIDKNVKTAAHILGDVRQVLRKLNATVGQQDHAEWVEQVNACKLIAPKEEFDGDEVNPREVLRTLNRMLKKDAIITTDVGQHQMWTAQTYEFTMPRTFITSGGLGTMGFGVGAAIGAKTAFPGRQVVCISGDGSFHMNCAELSTAVSYNIPIVVIVMNNSVLGMVRQWQKLFFDQRYSQTTLDRKTDYVKLAEAFGAKGIRLEKSGDTEKVLKWALHQNVPVVVDCVIGRDVNVFPMIPPGGSLEEIILEEGLSDA
jgi:acetolactate synthase-1/2/3 large subunit